MGPATLMGSDMKVTILRRNWTVFFGEKKIGCAYRYKTWIFEPEPDAPHAVHCLRNQQFGTRSDLEEAVNLSMETARLHPVAGDPPLPLT